MANEVETEKKVFPESSGRKSRVYTMPDKFYIDEGGGGERKNTFLIIGIIILVLALIGAGIFFLIQRSSQSIENSANISSLANVNIINNINAANLNANANANINANLNTNTQTNQNIDVGNINLFTDTVSNTNTQTNINTNTAVVTGQDSDKDGLTDIEEALYGTVITLPDTDSDGFADGQEILNGYDPNGTGRLENSSKVKAYDDLTGGYNLIYPAAWAVADDPQNVNGKVFTSGEEFVVLSVQDNTAQLSARDWYLTKSPGIDSSLIKTVNNWDKTLVGVQSIDGLTVYYVKADKAYVISYNVNILSEANYQTTFTMIYKSFKLGSSSTNLTNLNTNTLINLNNLLSNTNTQTNSNSNANTNINSNTNTSNTNSNSNTNLSNRL